MDQNIDGTKVRLYIILLFARWFVDSSEIAGHEAELIYTYM